MYRDGTYPTPYDAFTYGMRNNKINSISPGVIFYYNTITAPSTTFEFTVDQENSLHWNPMLVQQESKTAQAKLYDENCNEVHIASLDTSDPLSIQYTVTNAYPDHSYIIGIKYSPENLKGQLAYGLTSEYTFSTAFDGHPQGGSEASIPVMPKDSTSGAPSAKAGSIKIKLS